MRLLEAELGPRGHEEFEFVLLIGNFPWRDEEVYQIFESLRSATTKRRAVVVVVVAAAMVPPQPAVDMPGGLEFQVS